MQRINKVRAARRLGRLPPYPFAVLSKKVGQMRADGHDVIGLDAGSPDMSPPDHVVEKLIESARDPSHHGYAGYRGTPGLREAIAEYYGRRFSVALDPSTDVLPLLGSKEGLAHIALAYLDPGDIALVPDPGYPAYAMGAALAGAEAYAYTLSAENGFLPEIDQIPADVLKRARLMWINYPNNPTGMTASVEDLSRLVAFAAEHGILLCSDNPYAEITFDNYKAPSLLEVDGAMEACIEFNSLSKTYNMAGWRIGTAVGNAQAVEALLAVKSNVDSGLFRAVCDAGEVALRETSQDWIDRRNALYRKRRDLILESLPALGLEADTPKGAIYIWAKVGDGDDLAYMNEALEKAHVSLAAGRFYGDMGHGYVRLSLTAPDDRLGEALVRLQDWRAAV